MRASLSRRFGVPLLCGSLLFTLTVCERTGPTEPDVAGPMSLRVVSGDAQRAVIGTELPRPIVVQALNAKGKPLKSQLVNFVVVEGGGSVYAGSSITNNDGIAQEYWTMGPAVGTNKLEVRAVDPTTGEKQNFATISATGLPLPVATVQVDPSWVGIEVGGGAVLAATLIDVAGNTVTGREVVWSSSNTNVATIDQSGYVTGVGVGGPITVTATSEGRSGSAQVVVVRPSVQSVFVTPRESNLNVGETVQLSAQVYASAGHQLTDRAVTWISGDEAVATVSPSGRVTAHADGAVVIQAVVEGVIGTGFVYVTADVASITISPPSLTLTQGESGSLTADLRDANGNPVAWRQVSWTSSDQYILAVFGTGGPNASLFANAVGTVTVTATIDNLSATATVTVQDLAVAYPPDQYEPNDAAASAYNLGTMGEGGQSAIHPKIHLSSDQDWFVINAIETTSGSCFPGAAENYVFRVQISGMSGNDLDLEVRRGTPDGPVLRSTNGGDEDVVTFFVNGTCGPVPDEFRFYIRVYPYIAFPSNNPYSLSIQFSKTS